MADPLSVAASSFAVVGVVDVVLRASVECYRFLSEIKDAPAEIHRLRTCIKENEQLLDTLKKHNDDTRDPSSSMFVPTTESKPALDTLNSAVRAQQRELNSLQLLARRYSGGDKTWAKVKWRLDERKIQKSLEGLERSKAMLSAALCLMEGRRSASSQQKADIEARQNHQQTMSTMNIQLQELSIMNSTQREVLLKQDEISTLSTQHIKQIERVQKKLSKASKTNRFEHHRTRQKITEGNLKVIRDVTAKIDGLPIVKLSAPMATNLSDREIYFQGYSQELILPALLLMKNDFHQVILNSISQKRQRVSAEHMFWLEAEFNNLVASAAQEFAASYRGSTATAFDLWDYKTSTTYIHDSIVRLNRLASGDKGTELRKVPHRSTPQKKQRLSYDTNIFEISRGKIKLKIPRASGSTNTSRRDFEAQFSFVPSKGTSSTSIHAHFYKSLCSNLTPKLYVQLNAFRIVEATHDHFNLLWDGDLATIVAAFRSGLISPYDQDQRGRNICFIIAATFNRLDVLQYLSSQGIGPSNLNASNEVVLGYWSRIQNDLAVDDDFSQIISYLNEHVAMQIDGAATALAAGLSANKLPIDECKVLRQVRTFVELLMENHVDMELQNKDGRTAFLEHCIDPSQQSVHVIWILFELGANPHAIVDHSGDNAIKLAIKGSTTEEYGRENLQEKLSVLIEMGVDLNHQDNLGDTPSIDAVWFGKWIEWCKALEQNNKSIENVLQKDSELFLQAGRDLEWILDGHNSFLLHEDGGNYRKLEEDRWIPIEFVRKDEESGNDTEESLEADEEEDETDDIE